MLNITSVVTLCTLLTFRSQLHWPTYFQHMQRVKLHFSPYLLTNMHNIVFRLFSLILLLSLFILAARKDTIAETVHVASPSLQSKENGWFEGSCGINWSVDFVSTKPQLVPRKAIRSFYFHFSFFVTFKYIQCTIQVIWIFLLNDLEKLLTVSGRSRGGKAAGYSSSHTIC